MITRASNISAAFLLAGLMLALFAFSAKAGFTPNLEIQLMHDDNVRATTDDLKESDQTLAINPTLAWQWLVSKHQFDLGYEGGYGFYRDDTELNYNDHSLTAYALLDHSYRLNSEFELGYVLSHDNPGDTDAGSLLTSESDTWTNKNALTRITYGRNDSHGQIVLEVDYDLREHTNNDQEFRDYAKWGSTGTFYYRIAPNTRLLFEAGLADYAYPNQDSTGADQSNKSYQTLTGVTWTATAKTSGEFKIGYRNTRYDDEKFNDNSGLALSLDGDWSPNTYTIVNFGAVQENRQSAQESTGGFVYKELHASIQHGITPRTTLLADISYGQATFEDTSDRDYTSSNSSFGVTHDLLRWLDIGAEYSYENQSSDSNLNNFTRNLFMLYATTKLD